MIATIQHSGTDKNMETIRRSIAVSSWRRLKNSRWSTEHIQSSETVTWTPGCYIKIGAFTKPIEQMPRLNPIANCGHQVIKMCRCRFITCNQSGMWTEGSLCLCVERGAKESQRVFNNAVFSAQFFYKPRIAQKIKSI